MMMIQIMSTSTKLYLKSQLLNHPPKNIQWSFLKIINQSLEANLSYVLENLLTVIASTYFIWKQVPFLNYKISGNSHCFIRFLWQYSAINLFSWLGKGNVQVVSCSITILLQLLTILFSMHLQVHHHYISFRIVHHFGKFISIQTFIVLLQLGHSKGKKNLKGFMIKLPVGLSNCSIVEGQATEIKYISPN